MLARSPYQQQVKMHGEWEMGHCLRAAQARPRPGLDMAHAWPGHGLGTGRLTEFRVVLVGRARFSLSAFAPLGIITSPTQGLCLPYANHKGP